VPKRQSLICHPNRYHRCRYELYEVSRTTQTIGERGLLYADPLAWNSLPATCHDFQTLVLSSVILKQFFLLAPMGRNYIVFLVYLFFSCKLLFIFV